MLPASSRGLKKAAPGGRLPRRAWMMVMMVGAAVCVWMVWNTHMQANLPDGRDAIGRVRERFAAGGDAAAAAEHRQAAEAAAQDAAGSVDRADGAVRRAEATAAEAARHADRAEAAAARAAAVPPPAQSQQQQQQQAPPPPPPVQQRPAVYRSPTATEHLRPPRPEKREPSGMFKPVEPDFGQHPFPRLPRETLCTVPKMDPTRWFDDPKHTSEVATCDAENHYTFSRLDRESETIEITDCDGRVFYTVSDGLITHDERRAWTSRIDISHAEQVFVECRNSDGFSSFDFYPRAKYSPLSHDRARRVREKRKKEDAARAGGEGGAPPPEPPNVALIFVDSMSRANMMRSLPKTRETLRRLHETSGGDYRAYDFQLFNVVGSGTYQNAPPMLTGTRYNDDWQTKNMEVLPVEQADEEALRRRNAKSKTFPSLWDAAHHRGYATGFVEEGCIRNTGAVGRVWQHKVKKDLTDREKPRFKLTQGRLMDHVMFNVWCEVMEAMHVNDFFSMSTRPKLCFGGRYLHQHTFDYLTDVMDAYPDVPRLVFALMAEAHEASALRIRGMDDDLSALITDLTTRHPNTAILLVGDHGLGYGDFSKTDEARLEYKLPALFMALPSAMLAGREDLERALRVNQRRLVTSYDLYHTVRHMMDLGSPKHRERYDRTRLPPEKRDAAFEGDKHSRVGASLFYEVSANRTCKDVNIPMEYCSCTNYHTVEDANSPQYKRLAALTLHEMAVKTDAYSPGQACYPVDLGKVQRVQVATTSEKDKQLVVTFNTRADKARHLSEETFEGVLTQRADEVQGGGKSSSSSSKSSGGKEMRLKNIQIGWGFNTGKKVFEKETGVLPHDAGTVWCVNRWHTTEDEEHTKFDVKWYAPGSDGRAQAKTTHKVTDVVIAKSWVMAWQPLTHDKPLKQGEWTVEVRLSTGRLLHTAHFYIMGKEYPGVDMATLGRYWEVKSMKRLSAYEPHRKCADPDKPLEFCVCDTEQPFKAGAKIRAKSIASSSSSSASVSSAVSSSSSSSSSAAAPSSSSPSPAFVK